MSGGVRPLTLLGWLFVAFVVLCYMVALGAAGTSASKMMDLDGPYDSGRRAARLGIDARANPFISDRAKSGAWFKGYLDEMED